MINITQIKGPLTINFSVLNNAVEICDIMKKHQIKMYVYAFVSTLGVMKFGSSKDNEWRRHNSYGDRIYRQAHHIPGWGNGTAGPLTSGNDFLDILAHYPPTLTKDDVWVMVWDMTDYPFLAAQYPKEIEEFENELIQSYADQWGCRPIGNPKDMSYASNVSVVSDMIFDQFFENEEEELEE
jgi:hypothetical protein